MLLQDLMCLQLLEDWCLDAPFTVICRWRLRRLMNCFGELKIGIFLLLLIKVPPACRFWLKMDRKCGRPVLKIKGGKETPGLETSIAGPVTLP